jgi:hypothetical protein
MEYKGYTISDTESLLLYDILETQREVLAELKKLNEPKEAVADIPYSKEKLVELISRQAHEVTPILQTLDASNVIAITESTAEVKKPVRKPATRTKKKTKSKKTTK